MANQAFLSWTDPSKACRLRRSDLEQPYPAHDIATRLEMLGQRYTIWRSTAGDLRGATWRRMPFEGDLAGLFGRFARAWAIRHECSVDFCAF